MHSTLFVSSRPTPRFIAGATIALAVQTFAAPVLAPAAREILPSAHLQEGIASWYGKDFAGRRTASGEIFDPKQLTAASPTLPFGSMVQVTNCRNGRTAIVRINDRGPFSRSRILDCSEAAARRLGFLRSGRARVRIDWPPLYVVATERSSGAHAGRRRYWVQLGAFQSPEPARELKARAVVLADPVDLHRQSGYVRVHAGPFESRKTADRVSRKLREAGFWVAVAGPS